MKSTILAGLFVMAILSIPLANAAYYSIPYDPITGNVAVSYTAPDCKVCSHVTIYAENGTNTVLAVTSLYDGKVGSVKNKELAPLTRVTLPDGNHTVTVFRAVIPDISVSVGDDVIGGQVFKAGGHDVTLQIRTTNGTLVTIGQTTPDAAGNWSIPVNLSQYDPSQEYRVLAYCNGNWAYSTF